MQPTYDMTQLESKIQGLRAQIFDNASIIFPDVVAAYPGPSSAVPGTIFAIIVRDVSAVAGGGAANLQAHIIPRPGRQGVELDKGVLAYGGMSKEGVEGTLMSLLSVLGKVIAKQNLGDFKGMLPLYEGGIDAARLRKDSAGEKH